MSEAASASRSALRLGPPLGRVESVTAPAQRRDLRKLHGYAFRLGRLDEADRRGSWPNAPAPGGFAAQVCAYAGKHLGEPERLGEVSAAPASRPTTMSISSLRAVTTIPADPRPRTGIHRGFICAA